MGILLAGFLLFTRLFVFGVRGLDKGNDLVKAVSLAKSEITRLRELGRQNRWSLLLGENGRSFKMDGYDVELEVFERPTLSPSTDWERPYLSTPSARLLNSSTIQAVVRVRGHGAEAVLPALIGRPRLRLGTPAIEIRNVPGSTIPCNNSVTVSAHLLAADGSEIPATFGWVILPGAGNGTITAERNGIEATLTNQVTDPFGALTVAPGQCEIQAKALYFGEEILSAPYSVTMGS